MWVKLTRASGEPVLIDLSKVISIEATKLGTKLSFAILTKDTKGTDIFKGTNVTESVAEISRLLRVK